MKKNAPRTAWGVGAIIKFAPSYPRRKRFPRITSAGYEAGHRENFVGKARPTGRTIHYAAIHPRRQADGVFWPLPIKQGGVMTTTFCIAVRMRRIILTFGFLELHPEGIRPSKSARRSSKETFLRISSACFSRRVITCGSVSI